MKYKILKEHCSKNIYYVLSEWEDFKSACNELKRLFLCDLEANDYDENICDENNIKIKFLNNDEIDGPYELDFPENFYRYDDLDGNFYCIEKIDNE